MSEQLNQADHDNVVRLTEKVSAIADDIKEIKDILKALPDQNQVAKVVAEAETKIVREMVVSTRWTIGLVPIAFAIIVGGFSLLKPESPAEKNAQQLGQLIQVLGQNANILIPQKSATPPAVNGTQHP